MNVENPRLRWPNFDNLTGSKVLATSFPKHEPSPTSAPTHPQGHPVNTVCIPCGQPVTVLTGHGKYAADTIKPHTIRTTDHRHRLVDRWCRTSNQRASRPLVTTKDQP